VTFRTRFAPSPTGPLHLGHAYSAILAHDMAREQGGDFLLRIEDIDQSRARDAWEDQIHEDPSLLGLTWPTPVLRQSDRLQRYTQTLKALWNRDLIYPCTCTRRDIQAAASAPQEGAPLLGPDGVVYPGTCRVTQSRFAPDPLPSDAALRLNMRQAFDVLTEPLTYTDTSQHRTVDPVHAIDKIGDVVLARRDMGTSYHLSVVIDDWDQNISHVVRGQDLAPATDIHVILQYLLGIKPPIYHHHRLIRDEDGKRLAKRDDARAIAKYRADGLSPADIRKMIGL